MLLLQNERLICKGAIVAGRCRQLNLRHLPCEGARLSRLSQAPREPASVPPIAKFKASALLRTPRKPETALSPRPVTLRRQALIAQEEIRSEFPVTKSIESLLVLSMASFFGCEGVRGLAYQSAMSAHYLIGFRPAEPGAVS